MEKKGAMEIKKVAIEWELFGVAEARSLWTNRPVTTSLFEITLFVSYFLIFKISL